MQIQDLGQDIPYAQALQQQESAVAAVLKGGVEQLLLLEHAPVFTCGVSAQPGDVIQPGAVPVVQTGRGGQVTYHGPGQVVAYPIVDLRRRQQDLRWYVRQLQNGIVATLDEFGVKGELTDAVGVWVQGAKIAAIGIRVRKWVTFHGLALNVHPDLAAFKGIVPCGLPGAPVTSLRQVGINATVGEVKTVLSGKLQDYLAPLQ